MTGRVAAAVATLAVLLVSGCSSDGASSSGATGPTTSSTAGPNPMGEPAIAPADAAAAQRATAAFQDVVMAEAAGYASTVDTLGCFEDDALGGMGLHYLDETLMDATVDIAAPEALVYELDADGEVAGLVAHEYIVPIEAWTGSAPPSLFGMDFHRHPTLPLWVLHAWLWKDNVTGMFADWNPAVRPCPAGVPVFGVDLPAG